MGTRHHPRDLVGSDAGAAAVEFALIGTVLMLFLIGIFEYAFVMFVDGTLESAVLVASRYGITGSTEEGVSREDVIRDIILQRIHNLIPAEKLTIDTKVYQNFGQIGQPEPFTDTNHDGAHQDGEPFTDVNGNGVWDDDMGAAGLGGPGDVVLYTVEYIGTALTGMFEPIIGEIHHHAAVAVRNEPFGE
ncbi:MAG: TadE family protein [Rhodospirillales bacterium]